MKFYDKMRTFFNGNLKVLSIATQSIKKLKSNEKKNYKLA